MLRTHLNKQSYYQSALNRYSLAVESLGKGFYSMGLLELEKLIWLKLVLQKLKVLSFQFLQQI
jgi:hypothetical protein